jgi:signal transduction histidine kinase
MALERHLAEEVRQKYGIAFELEGDEGLSIPSEELKSCLFRISRELLTNVVRHSQAHNVKVSVHKAQDQIHVSVRDDGVGFSSAGIGVDTSGARRFGLFSVREQLDHLGGQLAIESRRGRGTTVTVVVPIEVKTRD